MTETALSKLPHGAVTVAVILAVGMCTALNLLVIAVVLDAFLSGSNAGLSENATQILTGWGGGVVSVISAVVGYQVGARTAMTQDTSQDMSPQTKEPK